MHQFFNVEEAHTNANQMLSFHLSGNYTDLYQLSMGQAYFLEGRQNVQVSFDYFFRKNPFQGGYVIFAGLYDLLSALQDFHFTDEDLAFLAEQQFDAKYLEYLKGFKFTGTINSSKEGDVVFPNRPVLRIDGNLLEVQLAETLLLNILNFESLIATKASRMRSVAGQRILSEFGLRRAQGPGAVLATRAAMVGGFNSTSNVYAAQRYGLKVEGTMAHSYIVSHETEIEAFRSFAKARPDHSVFLVDTYDTLRSGVPNAIKVAKEMAENGDQLIGIRLDSGDLAYLSKHARRMLDEAGLQDVIIIVSNQLDEYLIKSLIDQKAPIDVFGVGTSLITGQPDAALDGVFKLAVSDGKPRIKLSESLAKITLPGKKQVYRIIDENGNFYGADAVLLEEESRISVMNHPFEVEKSMQIGAFSQEPLLEKVMEKGKIAIDEQPLSMISSYSQGRLAKLPEEYKRFQFPHIYKVGISTNLKELRDRLRSEYKDKFKGDWSGN